MRESIGATWIFSICLTFIILFTAYLAISVNYAKAFKIKNHIVSTIEENEGYDGDLGGEVETYLTAQGYSAYGNCKDYDGWENQDCIKRQSNGTCGVCVYKMNVQTNDEISAGRSYYKVVAFFKFDLPVVNYITTFSISGETKYIYDYANQAGRY